jgi:two-component system sensor histidine kinase KdpD
MPLSYLLESQLHHLITRDTPEGRRAAWLRQVPPAALAVLATSAIAYGIAAMGFPSPESLSVLFVLPVLYSAIFHGLRMALFTSLLAVLAYNLVLLPPVWHIGLTDPNNAAKLIILALVAGTASALASRIRILAWEAMSRERILSGVYTLSQDMLGISNTEDMRKAAEVKLGELLEAEATIILKEEKEQLNDQSRFSLQNEVPTGKGTQHFTDRNDLMLPLRNRSGAIGVLCLKEKDGGTFDGGRYPSKVLATLAAQAASALEKAMIAESYEQQRREAEKEKFLSALLSSVSHDFKTPLVTVIGAFSSLQSMPVIKGDFGCRELTAGGLEEAQKLNRFITNLVEISRLEAGIENLAREPVLLRDILASALKSLYPLIHKQRFTLAVPMDFPLLNVNPALMELVFLNLLENAIKYGPATGEVKVIARFDGNIATIDIDDDGEGIPESEREAIFVKFYRSKHGDNKIAGTGLGLYICRSIVEVHGGGITAIDPHDGQGACVRITLPRQSVIPLSIDEEMEEA